MCLCRMIERGHRHHQVNRKKHVERYEYGSFKFLMHLLILVLKYFLYLWHIIVEVAGAEHHEHLEIIVFDEREDILLVYHLLLHAFLQVVVDKLRRNAGDRLLACGIYVAEHNLVEHAQAVGKVLVEVARAGVEMGLEDYGYLLVPVKLAYAPCALVDFLWMVCVVAEEDNLVVLLS